MTNAQTLKIIKNMEANAHRLLDDAAALREGLSGGSDSSKTETLSLAHQHLILERRRKHKLKK